MAPIAIFHNFGMVELIIIGVVALLIFGSSLPKMARNMGKGIMQFKQGVQEAKNEMTRELNAEADRLERQDRQEQQKQDSPPKPDQTDFSSPDKTNA